MPRPKPIADELTKPFWEASNERRLVVQNCTSCSRMQHPPEKVCRKCGSADNLIWRQVSGRGSIKGYVVTHDSRQRLWQPEQPFNIAMIELEEDPSIMFFSNLPGTPVDQVPVGAKAQVEFVDVRGQLVPDWRAVQ